MRSIETHFLSYKPDSDGVVTYYAFCFKGQPAAEYSANNEEDAD